MRRGVKLVAAGALLGVFVGVFIAAGGLEVWHVAEAPKPTPKVAVRGNVGQYLYSITNNSPGNKKLAQFDPTLPTDDTVVVNMLKALARDGYGVILGDDVSPAVESVDENNYVTFTTGKTKILFELFRNSNGQVGSARFWQE